MLPLRLLLLLWHVRNDVDVILLLLLPLCPFCSFTVSLFSASPETEKASKSRRVSNQYLQLLVHTVTRTKTVTHTHTLSHGLRRFNSASTTKPQQVFCSISRTVLCSRSILQSLAAR
mmetsp:Transcript_53572/g.130465  ORF Transcript_53572/g.130465 Transcript_53572/m.130465 type:complete len:117 (-) Transcript_53572:1337-1687(-)